jgi:epoxyqueuosine reductase
MILLVASYAMDDTDCGIVSGAQGCIARYACGPDYHDTIKPKLYALDAFIRARTGRQALGKVFVDTAPVLERDFAAQAGLGFIGRNCCLITPGLGSWTVLAGMMVPEGLTIDNRPWTIALQTIVHRPSSIVYGCGRCTRCLDACPTRAFMAPHVLDARRCISYLTIELRGPIPRELRPLIGDWIFGCDVCQEVCPYNRIRYAHHAERVGGSETDLADRQRSISLSELLVLDDAGFRSRFRGTPALRAKRRGLVRNACVAAGNSSDAALVPLLAALLTDTEPLVRGHSAWALGQIGGAAALRALETATAGEPDPWVCEEIGLAILALTSTLI